MSITPHWLTRIAMCRVRRVRSDKNRLTLPSRTTPTRIENHAITHGAEKRARNTRRAAAERSAVYQLDGDLVKNLNPFPPGFSATRPVDYSKFYCRISPPGDRPASYSAFPISGRRRRAVNKTLRFGSTAVRRYEYNIYARRRGDSAGVENRRN